MAQLSHPSPFSKPTTSDPSVGSHQADPQGWVVGRAQVSAVLGNCLLSVIFPTLARGPLRLSYQPLPCHGRHHSRSKSVIFRH